jgi:GcrA cell cycle regulator
MALDGEDRQALGAAPIALELPRFDWNEERVALLERRWAEGLSASTIAKELGAQVTRCAVLGKIHRLKLVQPEFKRRHPEKERAVLRRPRAPRVAARSRGGVRGASRLMVAFQALGLDALFGEPDAGVVHAHADKAFGPTCTLLELSAETCRWPIGDPDAADFVFCGAAPFKRYPYCIAHCLIAYRPDSSESESQREATPARADRGMDRAA